MPWKFRKFRWLFISSQDLLYLPNLCECIAELNPSASCWPRTRCLLINQQTSAKYWIFKMASLCYFLLSILWFSTFQNVIVAVFQVFLYFLYLLAILDSEIRKKNHEEDLKQTRRDRPIFKKKVLGNYEKCEFSNFFLFQRAKMIISVLVAWMIVDCNLAARVLISF